MTGMISYLSDYEALLAQALGTGNVSLQTNDPMPIRAHRDKLSVASPNILQPALAALFRSEAKRKRDAGPQASQEGSLQAAATAAQRTTQADVKVRHAYAGMHTWSCVHKLGATA